MSKLIFKYGVFSLDFWYNVENEPFEIPNSWKWCCFGDIAKLKMGKTPPKAEPKWWGNDYTWLQIADVIPNGRLSTSKENISKDGFKDKFNSEISPKETLIMSFKLTIGRVAILDKPCLHNEAIISIFPYVNKDFITRDYLFYCLPFLVRYGNSKNAIKGNTLNSTSLNSLPIPLPPLEEQIRIVNQLKILLPLIEDL